MRWKLSAIFHPCAITRCGDPPFIFAEQNRTRKYLADEESFYGLLGIVGVVCPFPLSPSGSIRN